MDFIQAVIEGIRLSYVALWIAVVLFIISITSILSTVCDDP